MPPPPEAAVGVLAALFLVCCLVWLLVQWLKRAPTRPDPWDEQVADVLQQEQTPALCHRCLLPHDPLADFCPECGAPVGEYTNWLPFPSLFSVGHLLRIGTSGAFRHSRLNVVGFFLLGIAEYTFLAPVYWVACVWQLCKPASPPDAVEGSASN